jgi:hypothetical protein
MHGDEGIVKTRTVRHVYQNKKEKKGYATCDETDRVGHLAKVRVEPEKAPFVLQNA